MARRKRWRAFVLDEGTYAEERFLLVVQDDEEQKRLLTVDIEAGMSADDILAIRGWARIGDWEPGVDGRHAPVRRAQHGRIPNPGVRVETMLPPDVLAQAEALVGSSLGRNRSDVVAALVTRGLKSLDLEES